MTIGKTTIKTLIKHAKLQSKSAVPICSGIHVGCSLLLNSHYECDCIVSASNIEYHGHFATHAEIAALSKAVSCWYSLKDVEVVCVWFEPKIQFPCGSCLQALSCHLSLDTIVIAASHGGYETKSLAELLPCAYISRK